MRNTVVDGLQYSYKLPVRARDLQLIAFTLIALSCVAAVTVGFRWGGAILTLLMVFLLVVRWARYPQGHTFAAKDKLTDTIILVFLAVVIGTLSVIAPS